MGADRQGGRTEGGCRSVDFMGGEGEGVVSSHSVTQRCQPSPRAPFGIGSHHAKKPLKARRFILWAF
jgi:hypothetical protein